jgi:hypothetical protein
MSSIALPVVAGFLRLRVQAPLVYYVLVLSFTSILVDLSVGYFLAGPQSKVLLINLQDILQFFLIALMYREMYGREYRSIFAIIVVFFSTVIVANSFYFQPITELQNYSWTFAGLLIIFMSLGWMFHVLLTMPVKKLVHYGEFWINTSFFCYFSVSLFLFLSVNYVFKGQSVEAKVFFWSFHSVNNILKNVLLTIGIYYLGERFADNKLQVV